MQAVLVMFRSDGERRSFSVTRDVTVIGRRDDCDLRIPLGDVSRKHARLIRDGDSLRLEDLGSSNGTHLNGQRIERDAVVQPGDSVQVGPVVFVLQVDGYPADEDLHPITSDAAAGADGGGDFGAAALGAAGGVATSEALGLGDDEDGVEVPGGGEYDPLGDLEPLPEGEEPTMELGHVGDEGTDLLEPGDAGEGELALGDDPLALGDKDPLAIGEDPLAIGEDPLAAGGNQPIALAGDDEPLGIAGNDQAIPLAGDNQPIGLAEDYEGIPLAGAEPGELGEGELAEGELAEGELTDGGLELTDAPQPAEGTEDDGLDDLLIDIAPEPPKKK
jgi:hypothetical protein